MVFRPAGYLFNLQRQISRDTVFEIGYLGSESGLAGVLVDQSILREAWTDIKSQAAFARGRGRGGIVSIALTMTGLTISD